MSPETVMPSLLPEALVDVLPIGVAVFDAEHRLQLFNPRFAELMGLPLELLQQVLTLAAFTAMMRELDEYASPEGENFLAARAAVDRSRPHVMRRVRPNGIVVEIGTDPLANGGWILTVTDVTALALAEDALLRRAQQTEAMFASIDHGLHLWSADKRLITVNRRALDIIDFPDEALITGLHYDGLITTLHGRGVFGSGSEADATMQLLITHDRTRPLGPVMTRPKGRFVEARSDPVPGGGFVVTLTDVTDRVAADAARERHAAEMDAMLANIRHGIMLWSPDRRLVAFNPIAERLFGAMRDGLAPGQFYDDLVRRQFDKGVFGTGEAAEAYLRVLLTHDRTQSLCTYRAFGENGVLEVRSEPAPDGGFILALTDVTDMRTTESELRQARDSAEAANTSKARFLATMSHELRTPLNAVIGFSDAMLRDRGGTDPQVVREYAEEINGAGKRLLLLINTILDVSRIEAGRYELGTDRIDFARLTQGLLRQSRNAAMAAEIELENELPADLPLVRGDERRMQQVLGHLLSNAVKFSEPGGVARISAQRDTNGDLLVRVIDTGIGIGEENLDRVFEPFTQIDSGLGRRYEGTGLGLYLSRALVEAHGGHLTLRSRIGEGTTAEIRLPARRVAESVTAGD